MTENKQVDLGKKIRSLRKSKGWDQPELARRVGSTATTVGRWENGLTTPRTHAIIALKRELGLTEDDFLEAFGVRQAPKQARSPLAIARNADFAYDMASSLNLLEKLVAIDYALLDGLSEDHEGTPIQWAPIFLNNMDCWKLILDNSGNIVGYWIFVVLSESMHQKMQSGQLKDSEITAERIKTFSVPGRFDAYFVIIFLKPDWRNACGMQKNADFVL